MRLWIRVHPLTEEGVGNGVVLAYLEAGNNVETHNSIGGVVDDRYAKVDLDRSVLAVNPPRVVRFEYLDDRVEHRTRRPIQVIGFGITEHDHDVDILEGPDRGVSL